METEQRCADCFFADHYLPGDQYETSDAGVVTIDNAFHQRWCITEVGNRIRSFFGRNPVKRAVLAEKDDGCPTGRFMEKQQL